MRSGGRRGGGFEKPVEPPVVAGRSPPHDLDAEATVLSACLLNRDALDSVIEILQADHFYSEANATIYRGCVELAQASRPVDIISIASWLRDRELIQKVGGPAYLAQLTDATPAVYNVAHHARTVKEKWRLRRVIAVCQQTAAQGYGDVGEPQQFIDAAEQAIYDLARTPETSTVHPLKEVLTETFKKLSEAKARGDGVTGLATQFLDLDRMMSGLHAGELIIVAARPGMGKTSFVMNIAVNVARSQRVLQPSPGESGYGDGAVDVPGQGVVVFSLEMPSEQVATRMLCSEARVDLGKLRGGFTTRDDWSRLTGAATALSSMPVWIDDSPGLSILELRAKVRRIRAERAKRQAENPNASGLGLVVVDYLQLMRGRPNVQSREQEISEISRGLKELAKELEVPVIALSQLNRGVEGRNDKRPMLSDLRECVPGDTLVLLADGRRVPIRELVGMTPEVMAMDERRRIVTAKSDKVWCVGKREVIEISLASGRTVRCTPKHRLFSGREWQRVQDLREGDRIAIARSLPEPRTTSRWPEARLVLLGHLIGDGSYLSGKPLRYTTASEENSAAVARAAREEFGVTVNRHAGRGNWHQLVFSGNGNRWHPAGINAWLRELGIFNQRSHEKRVPPEVFALPNEQLATLLRHLWATDGTIHVRKKSSRGSSTVSFTTSSHALALDVAALLLRLGIVARIQRVHHQHYRSWYHVSVGGADQQRRFLELVGGFGPRASQTAAFKAHLDVIDGNTNVDTLSMEVFARVKATMAQRGVTQRAMAAMRGTSYGGTAHFKLAPSRATVADYAELLEDDALRAIATSDLFWDRIVAIQQVGNEQVYDLTVPGPACWLADGVVSHNSGAIEQDADAIIFIYRDDYYQREQQAADAGISELLLAKQRNGPTGTVKVRFFSSYTRFDNLAPGEYDDQGFQ
jgi:replicative DNA helicase